MNSNALNAQLIEAVNFSSEKILHAKNWEKNIYEVLEKLGRITNVDKVYIFENTYDENDNFVMTRRFEWVNNDLQQTGNDQLTTLSYQIAPKIHEALAKKQPFTAPVKALEQPVKDILTKQGIVDILLTPIFVEDQWHGFIGYSDYKQERKWDQESILILHTIANIIGSAIQKTHSRKSLEISQQYFASLFDKAPEGIAIVSPDGIVKQVNDEFCRLFGYRPKEAVGNNLDELILPREMLNEARELTQAAAKGEKVKTEGVRYTKESVPAYVSIIGVPIIFQEKNEGIYVIYHDISERKLAEKNLQESQTKFKTLFDSSKDAIFLMKEDIFIDCNKAAILMFETTEEEIVGESPLKFSPLYQPSGEESEQLIKNKIQQAMQGDSLTFDFTHISGKGVTFETEISLNKVILKESTFIQAIARDITSRKKSEKDLLFAKEKAEESDRLKTAFLASMSHEIRTPMNHILGGLDLLLDPDISAEEKEEFHNIIKKSSTQLLKLIDDIIDVSHLDAGQVDIKKESFKLDEFLREMEEEVNNFWEDKPHLDFQINTSAHVSHVDHIHTDRVRLKQVLISLLSNAFKFTNEGSIELGYELKNDDTLRFFVSDTGIGVPPESKKVIFEQFRQVDYEHTREYEGAGLGLTLAKGMVELMGGNIWVESEGGKGTTFYFTVNIEPAAPTPEAKPAYSGKETKEYDWENKTILIVEDEEMNYQYLKTVLRKTKANLLWAENGVEGVKMAKENEVDIILMDIQMPEMNGYEATRQILEIKPDIPIIAQTAHALKEEQNKCFDAGAVDYMSKPLNRKKLLELISKYI
ncbi:MAG: PAS domain S-box protein [Bacteroidales bacterium]|nr:PAS domain S-box protein [Bacteroidales bacterium]